MEKLYITEVKDLYKYNNRYKHLGNRESKIIVHREGMFHFTSADTWDQLTALFGILGISYKLERESENLKEYSTKTRYISKYFSAVAAIPCSAKKIKGHSNGSIVDCYFTNVNEVLTIYRPNPNCKEIYKPLDIVDHIKFTKSHAVI